MIAPNDPSTRYDFRTEIAKTNQELRHTLRTRVETVKSGAVAACRSLVPVFRCLVPLLRRLTPVLRWLLRRWLLLTFHLAVVLIIGTLYWTISSMGLRLTMDSLCPKLHTVVGLSFFRHFQGWRDIDLANVVALGLFLMVWLFSVLATHIFCYGSLETKGMLQDRVAPLVYSVAAIMSTADAVIFYRGLGEQMLGSDEFSAVQVLLTLAYSASLYALAFVHCLLERPNGDKE